MLQLQGCSGFRGTCTSCLQVLQFGCAGKSAAAHQQLQCSSDVAAHCAAPTSCFLLHACCSIFMEAAPAPTFTTRYMTNLSNIRARAWEVLNAFPDPLHFRIGCQLQPLPAASERQCLLVQHSDLAPHDIEQQLLQLKRRLPTAQQSSQEQMSQEQPLQEQPAAARQPIAGEPCPAKWLWAYA